MENTKTQFDNEKLRNLCIDRNKPPRLNDRRMRNALNRIAKGGMQVQIGKVYDNCRRVDEPVRMAVIGLYMQGLIQSKGNDIFLTQKGEAARLRLSNNS